ncbi:AT-rich interactive domain-containing protein 4B isoform X3 [Macrosteles quadrilineatus]|uniref:AT-rich interactive domain-containing protein 4B isoform X3 n=1 Tax=Macrosteles quadrilineatus TaxID=74068 RepID=UPI0023E1C57C|nr:AT-rich interactive domain-containing protein 4B isoform X3 [Macrosteles quadrilineatus]
MSCEGFKILSLMHRWSSKREMMGDDPPYLAVGTEVSAKYKGAFCEAKVRKIVRSVKCKIAYKLGLGTAVVTDDQIKGTLRAGSVVEVKHPDKKEYVEATIIKIQDCSQYTVVFDDGDITTLRRTALCLKSGRHFAESETLDQLPLTHPEHFGNPVIGGRRGRRNRHDDSSDDDESIKKGKQPKEEKEADIGKVVCVEISEKKKQKDNWFPGLVVAPTAQDTVKINVKEDYLVRSFKDGRYYTVPKKEATLFTREIGQKVDNNTLRTAVEKALLFLDREELPPHWDRELLFGLNEITDTDSDGAFDSDTSDDEPREEKDHFVAQLYKFMDDRGTPINKGPTINGRDVDLYKLFKVVHKLGGYNRVTNHNQWKTVSHKLGFGHNPTSVNLVKHAYKKFLHSFEDFYRKLGCTMVNHPRGHRSRHRSNRSLIRDKDKALPSKEKQGEKDGEEIKDETTSESIKDKDIVTKDDLKPKETINDNPKPLRKDSQKLLRNEKSEKKDETKPQPSASKIVESPIINKANKEEKIKSDDREERIKMREMLRHDNNSKDDIKAEKDTSTKPVKDAKNDENQRVFKGTRRELKDGKKEEKEDEKNKISSEREIRPKKVVSTEVQGHVEDSKDKKSRSLFSKITGSRRIKPMSDNKIPRANKPMGLNAVRQKRTFSERMKAMVKKLKMKTGVKQLRQKSPLLESKDSEEKRKPISEENVKTGVPQLTRSKSKEEVSAKSEKPKATLEKKPSSNSITPHSNLDKKQGHSKKRKDDDKPTNSDETLDQLPNYKSVAVGDKLKVYYGPTHESKVTYEAKVLNLKEEDHETLYLVHYTGWNTRYDEWIKRGRIADNLSWSPGRAKRTRHHQTQQSQSQSRVMKRSKSGGGGEGSGGGGCGRSTTPSSVTSSSSRTKSPAVSGAPRTARSRGRSRRASGHTHTDLSESEGDDDYESDDLDVSRGPGSKDLDSDEKESKDTKEMLLEKIRSRSTYRRRLESGCESEDPSRDPTDADNKSKKCKVESEEEGQFERTRSRSEKRKSEEVSKVNVTSEDIKKEGTDGYKSDRLRSKRKAVEEKTDNTDEKDTIPEKEFKAEPKVEDTKPLKVTEEKHNRDSKQLILESEKIDSETQETDNKKRLKRKVDDLPFDEDCKEQSTNERRRSRRVTPRKEDLKFHSKSEEEQSRGREFDLNQIRSELKGINPSGKVPIEAVSMVEKENENDDKVSVESCNTEEEETKTISSEQKRTIPEDIYEFKEPEPFEFEVRSKCSEDKSGKIQRRSFGRVCEEPSSVTLSPVRKKLTKIKSESPSSSDSKQDIKKPNPKSEDSTENPAVESENVTNESLLKLEKDKPVPPLSPAENPNEESDYDSETEASENKTKTNKGDDVMQSLSLFDDLPEEREGGGVDEDSEDRLVISEPETESESQGPLFSHQQRDHEDFFPTSITQSSSVENSQNKSPFSGFNEGSKDGNESKDGSIKTPKEDKDEEEDPIMSAIQRVQRAFSQSPGDDDSNDIDLLSELPDPTHRKDKDSISSIKEDENSRSSKESNDSQNGDNIEDQMSQSNEDSDDNINDPIKIDNSKVVEEINIESSDSEASVSSVRDETTNVPSEMERTEISSTILKDDTDKADESQDTSVADEEEKDSKYAESEEESDQMPQDNNANEEKESDDNCLVKEDLTEDTQSEAAENTNDAKEEVTEELTQVDLNEEVILEAEVTKKDADSENEEDGNNDEEEEFDENVEEVVEELNDQDTKESEVKAEIEEPESNLESLLCEETIPGSPAPSCTVAAENPTSTSPELPFASAAVVYKPPPAAAILPPPPPPPTPPTTPESSLSPISNSPVGERSGSSPTPENGSIKSNRDSSEVDLEKFASVTKTEAYEEGGTHGTAGSSNSSNKKSGAVEENESQVVKKRRRSVKRTEENPKRPKLSHRSPRHNNASESDDDTSENSLDLVSLNSRSPRPSKYNFFVQLDPELDGSQRIAVLQQKLAELRKTYMSVKAELACIDRRRKKLRRREREASIKTTSSKPEVTCS